MPSCNQVVDIPQIFLPWTLLSYSGQLEAALLVALVLAPSFFVPDLFCTWEVENRSPCFGLTVEMDVVVEAGEAAHREVVLV